MTNEQQHIANLKKLKSFHNGSYGADIDRAIKALEQEPKMVHRETLEQVMWERNVAINQLKELGYGLGAKIKTDKYAISRQAVIDACEQSINIIEAVDRIMDLPSVKPQEPKIVPIAEIKFDEDELKELVDKAVLTVTLQEPIDYKAQYESFAKKAEIVISQLRADRDRLTDVFDKIRAEIMDFEEELFHRPNTDYSDYAAVRHCMEIIDKYKAESEGQE